MKKLFLQPQLTGNLQLAKENLLKKYQNSSPSTQI